MKAVRWLLPLLSLLAVLWFTWRDVRGSRTGPGPLHSAHAARPELDHGAKCDACHVPGAGIDADGCNRCHAPIARQMESGTGLHGKLGTEVLRKCERCHGEHHGDDAPLLAAHAFARAGVPDVAAYDHAHVDYRLTGVHAQLACVRCHARADDVVPPAAGRYLGQSGACTSCHDDVHRAAFGADCASCHGQERPWREVPGFRHDRFPLQGAHGHSQCGDCHANGTAFELAAERAATLPVRGCRECHADPHGGQGDVKSLRLDDTADCARCHTATTWSAGKPDLEAHAALGFPLRGPHAAAGCALCHGDAQNAPRWRAAPPQLAACGACHADPHVPEVRGAAACASCHHDDDAAFADGRLLAAQHVATGFALVAPHADVACAKCHGGQTWPERFPGRQATDCAACHRDVHGGQFAGAAKYAQCTACHQATRFAPHTFGVAAHGDTALPLTGAHAAVPCQACHKETTANGRVFHGTPTTCAACHRDVHSGSFDRPGRPARVEGREGCARCHDTSAFAPLDGQFDHTRWTGYELVGAHTRVGCAQCHPSEPKGKRLGRAFGTTCASCHRDPHAGQFLDAGRNDCTRCHSAIAWQQVDFDHAKSAFPLDATHAPLPCRACHLPQPVGGAPVVRYKPLGTACGDCHRLGRSGEVRR
ncbi:MAG: hypothetical protein JNK15_20630 [Planctomycetes bacterium]|nr:hypothetical protein [Planctomycetota bacterium]